MDTPRIAVPPTRRERWLLAGATVLALAASFAIAGDRLTSLLETVWAMAGLALVAWQWNRFPLTRLLCWLLFLHALVLVHGGAHTYAQTPLGFWLQDLLGTARNPWDRLGHWMQGFRAGDPRPRTAAAPDPAAPRRLARLPGAGGLPEFQRVPSN